MITRRNFFTKAAVAAAGTAVVGLWYSRRADEPVDSRRQDPAKSTGYDQEDTAMRFPPGEPGKDYAPVITPNGTTLPYKIVDGVKIFHLILEKLTTNSHQDYALIAGGSMVRSMVRPLRLWKGTGCAFM